MSTGEPKIALVHDELIRRGGAEVVFEEIAKLFPEADVFALYAGRPVLEIGGRERVIHTSFLQKFPGWLRRHPGRVLPFLLPAAEQFDFSQYDIVLSSASGFAKAIITRANVPHICYCHTPTRYLWDAAHEVQEKRPRWQRLAFNPLSHYLRMADYAAAKRVDTWLANSVYTQQRIKKYYGAESQVVYPPIRHNFYFPKYAPRTHFLMVGRLTATKHFEEAIAVCEKLRLPLRVVGSGQVRGKLLRQAGTFTTFLGKVSDEELRELYRSTRAILIPGIEDFGMVAAEALACGTPVVSQNAGGVTEIVASGRSGVLYDGQGVEALAEGLRQFLAQEATFQPEDLRRQAQRFEAHNFHTAIKNAIAEAWRERNNDSEGAFVYS